LLSAKIIFPAEHQVIRHMLRTFTWRHRQTGIYVSQMVCASERVVDS